MSFKESLREQRWDDHRYYHQSRVNQSLHFISALSFLCAYVLIFFNPVAAAIMGWVVAMVTRQIGHFFFEPKDYDVINQATHEYKESIKVGYNLFRKVVLLSIWISVPVVLYFQPAFFGLVEAHTSQSGYIYNVSIIWIWLGAAALLFRTAHLFFLYDVQTGLVWLTKILTDPFHDIKIYHKSPIYLLKGELIDPMDHVETAS